MNLNSESHESDFWPLIKRVAVKRP